MACFELARETAPLCGSLLSFMVMLHGDGQPSCPCCGVAAAGVIIVSLGTRYQSYCANVSRTYIINPNKAQEAQYNALLAAHEAACAALKDGQPAKASMEAAIRVRCMRCCNGCSVRCLETGVLVIVVPGNRSAGHWKALEIAI